MNRSATMGYTSTLALHHMFGLCVMSVPRFMRELGFTLEKWRSSCHLVIIITDTGYSNEIALMFKNIQIILSC